MRPAEGGQTIRIVTWVEEFKMASAIRASRIMRGDVELVRARTEWVFVSIEGNRPKKMVQDMINGFMTGPK